MELDDYIWYLDDNNLLHSVGYPINNIFKENDIAPIQGCDYFNTKTSKLAIPVGIVLMNDIIKSLPKPEYAQKEPIHLQAINEGLYSKLVQLVNVKKIVPKKKLATTRKRHHRNKKK